MTTWSDWLRNCRRLQATAKSGSHARFGQEKGFASSLAIKVVTCSARMAKYLLVITSKGGGHQC